MVSGGGIYSTRVANGRFSGTMSDSGRSGPPPSLRLWTLQITRESRAGIRILTVSGRIAAASAPVLANALAQELRTGSEGILLDLAGVDYVSSAGLRALTDAAREAGERRVGLALCGLSEPVRLAFDLAGMLDAFTIEPSREAAGRQSNGPSRGAGNRGSG